MNKTCHLNFCIVEILEFFRRLQTLDIFCNYPETYKNMKQIILILSL